MTRRAKKSLALWIIILSVMAAGKCAAQSFDLIEICGYGYSKCEKIDGVIIVDEDSKTLTINVVQSDFRLFRMKEVNGKVVKFNFAREKTIELETIGSTSFLHYTQFTDKIGDVYYLFELVRKYSRHDEERTYYTTRKL